MAVVASMDATGFLRVTDARLATPLIFARSSVDVANWEDTDEVASKLQSWETVSNDTTGAVTGSNAVTS